MPVQLVVARTGDKAAVGPALLALLSVVLFPL